MQEKKKKKIIIRCCEVSRVKKKFFKLFKELVKNFHLGNDKNVGQVLI